MMVGKTPTEEIILRRYRGANPESLISILSPLLIPIHTLDNNVFKMPEENHYRASFTILVDEDSEELMVRGRTGKFVPQTFIDGGSWKEIAKGRIIEVDEASKIASGEVYIGAGGTKAALESAIGGLTSDDYLEIDAYGAAAKVLSGLVEYELSRIGKDSSYTVRRMPEDMARHLGDYYHYDFKFTKGGVTKRVEAKSLWGTDTRYARLIHSLSKGYKTSSCKFETQEIFAVSLFLRTGDIRDFAFARSISNAEATYGLPPSSNYSDYVNQNPPCNIGDGSWFATIDEVWDLD